MIPSLNAITNPLSPPFDLSIPDVYRYQIWKQDFGRTVRPTSRCCGSPATTPAARRLLVPPVADGDLAVGKVVDEISHSKYWKDSAIFVVEDDSQAGVDHVDGHRAPIQVISPWAAHGKTISTYYSQISMVRTIEQILGAEPLNQKVAAATPMFDAFQSKAGQHTVHRGAEPDPADRERQPRSRLRPDTPTGAPRRPTVAAADARSRRPGAPGPRSSTSPAVRPRPTTPTRS